MGPFSKRSQVAPFHAMDVMGEAFRLQEQGEDVCFLTVGQPSALLPPSVRELAAGIVDTQVLGYTDAIGRSDARRAIAAMYAECYGLDVYPSRIILTTGSSAGFSLAFLTLADAGGRIAITSPGYPAYRSIIGALSMECVEIPTDGAHGHMLDIDVLLSEHRKKPIDALLIASPANPTGAALSAENLQLLVDTCRENGIAFISDEIYHRLRYTGDDACALQFDDQSVVINSFSKYYCMTGWRIGWMVVPENMVRTVETLGQNLYISAPDLSQRVVPEVLAQTAYFDEIRDGYLKNRAVLIDRLPSIGIQFASTTDGAFYAWCDVSGLTNDSMDFAKKMLREIKVACAPGVDFDTENGHRFMRLSYAGSHETVCTALDRMEAWLK
ncbi:MAG: aminotransferase class I/II-fold pyridoxal phosphate-dependent enzyme [Pseudomonadota bacterium]